MVKVCIRADGGKDVGLGHIMRCLSLAQTFRRNGDKVYFFSKLDEGIKKIRQENFEFVRLVSAVQEADGYLYDNPTHLADEVSEMIALLQEYRIDVLVIDTYNVSREYFLALKPYVNRLAYVDDINKFPYPVDIVINGNITGKFLGYQKYDQEQGLFLGTEYNMIRDEFSNIPPRTIRRNVKEILITTGGGDPFKLTSKLLDILLKDEEYRHLRLNVLVGSGFTNCGNLGDLSKNCDNVFLYANSVLSHILPDIIYSEVSPIMLRSDLAISAGGSTLYELAACGTPAMAIILADNQEGIVHKMDELGYVKSLGWYAQLSEELVLDNLGKIMGDVQRRREMSTKGQRLVDGKGTERIVRSILQNFEEN